MSQMDDFRSEADLETISGATAEGGEAPDKRGEQAQDVHRSPLALRPCSDCGTMVSRRASVCPHCGRSFHESSLTIPYRGEHPIPVLAVFTMLAIAFVLVTPVVAYGAANTLAYHGTQDETAAGRIAFLAAVGWVISMVACAVLGGAVGAPRMAYVTGIFLGLFFGPLGVFAAFAIDKRPQCLHCFTRLGGLAEECPSCHSRLTWEVQARWY